MTVGAVAIAAVAAVTYWLFADDSADEPGMPPTTPPSLSSAPGPSPSATTGATSPTQQASPPTTSGLAEQAPLSPEDAGRQGLAAAFTWNPATDASPTTAFARAKPWLTEAMAQRTMIDARTQRGPGIQWERWAGDGTQVVVTDIQLDCSGCPPDTDSQVHRVATIRQVAVTGDRQDAVEPDTVVWVSMIRTGNRWLIDSIEY
uniref:hypothetical protein n=1 Tax=Nocardia suismassiliense TaxID=2077092 RepID=UPI003F490876